MNRCTDMNQNIENVVESLTNLVNDAKGVLRSFGEGNCNEKNGTVSKPSCSVNDSLKKLYRSTGKAAVNAVWGWKLNEASQQVHHTPLSKKRLLKP